MKDFLKRHISAVDPIISLLALPAGLFFRAIRKAGIQRFPMTKKALEKLGVFPIRDHYYEPLINFASLKYPLSKDRNLPGINWNLAEQIELIRKFHYNLELVRIPKEKTNDLEFHFYNGSFESGDAEFWYNVIRFFKPKRIFEIGSGNSTLMAINAIRMNKNEDPQYSCRHLCVEPYEMPWLEKKGIEIVRRKVEDVGISIFQELEMNDILFIDSSHMIRPQGDVLFEYLELIPMLKRGVVVHIHDIFSPKDYPKEWVVDQVRFWNEQYLLEAFLTSNAEWKVIGALNFLHHNYFDDLKSICPFLLPEREPGSFYIQKIA